MIIDWIKIKRYIQNSASDVEKEDVEVWLKRSDDSHTFVNNAKNFYSVDFRFFEDESKEVDVAWKKVMGHTVKKNGSRRKFLTLAVSTISVAAALISVYFGVYYETSKVQQVVEVTSGLTSTIPEMTIPKEATLILADGRVVNLAKAKELEQEVANFKIEGNRVKTIAEAKPEEKASLNQICIPKGDIYSLILSDSTKVTLNAGSSLLFPSSFGGKERRVLLIGEAYFSVTRDEEHPFVVELDDGSRIEVLGTEFNVKSRPNSNSETTLVKGSVRLHSQNDKIVLAPGELCMIDKETKRYDITTPDLNSSLAWTRGEFVFKNKLLSEIVEELENWYDVDIVIANEFVKRKRFHIYINRSNSIENVLDKLTMTEQIGYTISGKNIVIDNFNR